MSLIIFGKWRTLTLFNGIHISQPKPEMLQKDYQVLGWKKKGRENLDDDDVCIMKQTVKWSLTITTFWKSDPLESQKTSAIRRQTEKLKLSNTDRKER